ncbi:MAG: hypothetical protein HY303_18050 [Candidatus Wallbacteria bacterium]|nr:hypothetical protein [Candidatus Wallbacteria bacterium]
MRNPRRGIGTVFIIVLGIVFLLCAAGLAFLWCSSNSIGQAVWSAGGTMAAYGAESVVEEAYWLVQKDVCDPSSPIFREVRQELLFPGAQPLDLSRYYQSSGAFRRFLDTSPDALAYRALELEPPLVTVEHGKEGPRLRIEASAKSANAPSSRRTVVHRRYIGITPVAPPAPLDQCAFVILRYDFLSVLPKIVGETRRLLELYDKIPQLMSAWAQVASNNTCVQPFCFNNACCGCVLEGCCGCPAAHCHRNPAKKTANTWYYDLPQQEFKAYLYPCERYPFPIEWADISPRSLRDEWLIPADSAIVCTAPTVDLEKFDHERILVERYEPRIRDLKDAADELNRLILQAQGVTFCKDAHKRWHDDMMRKGRDMRRALVAAIGVLNEVLKHIRENSRPGLTSAVYPPPQPSPRPLPLAFHLESADHLAQVLAQRNATSGHLAYFGRSQLRLDLNPFRGRAVISSPTDGSPIAAGDIVLDDANRDRLLLAAPEIAFEGAGVEASVLSLERTRFPVAPHIRGNLILGHLSLRSVRGPQEDLKGTVDYDPRVWAGGVARDRSGLGAVSLGHFAVGISPKLELRRVVR